MTLVLFAGRFRFVEVRMNSIEAWKLPSTSDARCAQGSGLDRREREILAFEQQWWKHPGAKERAVRELFDLSATRYYQVLNALLDKPEAMAADPMLVKRLRRLRASRQRTRAAQRRGADGR